MELTLSDRDRAVVELVGKFQQLEARHVAAALFPHCASLSSPNHALKRLVEMRYLARLGRLAVAPGSGTGSYVYQLGSAGWRLLGRPGRYWPFRAVNLHTLAIADCFATLCAMQRRGELTLIQFGTEPSCHQSIAGIQLTPDGFAELGCREQRTKLTVWWEIDRGTEHVRVIKDKCIRYWHAYQQWPEEVFPYVVFIVPDVQRQRAIEKVISGGPLEAQEIFRAWQTTHLSELVGNLTDQAQREQA